MGLATVYQRPRTSAPHPAHPVYPYLLRDLAIERPLDYSKEYKRVIRMLEMSTAAEVTITGKECNRFCTYTQGYFGNEGGKSSYDTGNGCQQQVSTRNAIQTAIQWWASRGGLKIGNITVATVDAVLKYLPGGGPSDTCTSSSLDDAPANTLLAQTLASLLSPDGPNDVAPIALAGRPAPRQLIARGASVPYKSIPEPRQPK